MKKAERAAQARRHLDRRLAARDLSSLTPTPRSGWIRAIRDALGMTSQELAGRLGITQAAETRLERSEVEGGIRLSSLRKVADALGCDVVYGFVPRTTLEDTVRERATMLASRDVAMVDQMMRLEDQNVSPDQLRTRVAAYADELISSGRLWVNGLP